MKTLGTSISLHVLSIFVAAVLAGCGGNSGGSSAPGPANVPADIQAVFNKPMYQNVTWGLRVVDNGKALMNLRPNYNFLIGSVRKIFSVSELLNEVGPTHTYDTPVYRQGQISGAGVLNGDLILVASGDLTMGGRTNPDGSIAISDYDHNEADSLGNAVLTAPNPLAGYIALAGQVAAAGIKEITGDVVIDDRLFQPYNFRGEFNLRPIFVNDDAVDLTINPTTPGSAASVVSRPVSAALAVNSTIVTSAADSKYTVQFVPDPEPTCIGTPGCTGVITGNLPIDFVPPLTNSFPVVQTFRIVQPSNYARTVFIEALQAAGVTVDAPAVEQNPVQLLPAKDSYAADNKVAELTGLPYTDYAKLILKVSYNIGADTSLLLYGLTQGVDNMTDALNVEKENLAAHYGIPSDRFDFVDGSGGSFTTATNAVVTKMLDDMTTRPTFADFFAALPILGVDGSLAFVTDFQSDPTLAGATGQVRAKTGTFVQGTASGPILKTQALGGYIDTKSGKHLVFELAVNNVTISGLSDILQVFQDEGTISAILWRDN
ncbi:MAG TPA: D-alanyl-D-alanine carboxypeptidase [Candidatus Binataceae bacterium]|nr:D-alanyl-D-alanine carboxypeptidase [Candidatus Binataceae bacterium]